VPLTALAVTVTLVAAVVGVVRHHSDDPEPVHAARDDTARAPTTTAPAPPVAGPLGAVLPGLEAFVERERGLAFKRPVKVSLLDDATFNERAVSSDPASRKEVEDAQAALQAMGLLRPGVDLWRAVIGFVQGSAVGSYEPGTDELIVRGAQPTPYVRMTLVHELTHALEDQHFDIDRPELGDEASLGFEALVEGSAVRIEERYRSSLSPDERRQAAREEAATGPGTPADVPAVVEEAFAFPYTYGPGLVAAVLRAGGQPRLDAAYADPPRSSEQVVQPAHYLGGDRPRPVPTPRADRPPFDDGEIGQLFLLLMLDSRLGHRQALEAALGWGGDHYASWKDGTRTCLRADFVMDTPADTDQLARALTAWAQSRPGSSSAAGTSLTTCG
jgi:hypothetical protein